MAKKTKKNPFGAGRPKTGKGQAVRVVLPPEVYEIVKAQAKHEERPITTICLRAIKNRLIADKFLPAEGGNGKE